MGWGCWGELLVAGVVLLLMEEFSAGRASLTRSNLPKRTSLPPPFSPLQPQVYALDAPEEQAGGTEAAAAVARAQPLALSAAPGQASVAVGYWEQAVLGPAGVAPIGGEGGGVLGRGGIDRVLVAAPGHEPLLTTGVCVMGAGARLDPLSAGGSSWARAAAGDGWVSVCGWMHLGGCVRVRADAEEVNNVMAGG